MSLTQLSPSLFIQLSDCAIFSLYRKGRPQLSPTRTANMFHNNSPNKIIWFNNTTIWPDFVWSLIVFVFILYYFVGLPKPIYTFAAELNACSQWPATGLAVEQLEVTNVNFQVILYLLDNGYWAVLSVLFTVSTHKIILRSIWPIIFYK